MKKIITILILLLLFSVMIHAGDLESIIFESVENSVVYIEAALYLDKKHFSNHELVKKVEDKYKSKILDSFVQIQTGSGMFVTKNGYILTNHHVIYIENLNLSKIEVYNGIIYHFLSKISDDVLSNSDYKILKSDIKKAIDDSRLYYRVMVNNKDYYECRVVKSDKELDVALLKVDANKRFRPILIGDSSQLKVGNLVITIGYPLASIFFEFFKDLKSTMTTGLISAIRSDNWGIQHTSAINPGNSGGPLLNKNGELVGINVGMIYDANGLYFSIPINKVKTWLNDSGYNSLVQINRFDSRELPLYRNIDVDFADMNNKIQIKLEESYRVYVNGEYKGKTPLTLENLPLGTVIIRVDSDNEYFEQKFNIKKISNEAYSFIPLFNKNYGKLIVNTNPSGMDIYLDGISVGTTPYNEDITSGKHKIKLSSEGYIPVERDINIVKNEAIKINEKLIKGIKVTFKNKLPEDVIISIKNKNTNFNFNSSEVIYLAADKYEAVITSNRFDDQILNIDLTGGKELEVELKIIKYKSKLVLENYNKGYSVFIDNEDVTDKIADDNSIFLYEGTHQLKVMEKKKKKFNKKINVEKDKDLVVNLQEDD